MYFVSLNFRSLSFHGIPSVSTCVYATFIYFIYVFCCVSNFKNIFNAISSLFIVNIIIICDVQFSVLLLFTIYELYVSGILYYVRHIISYLEVITF